MRKRLTQVVAVASSLCILSGGTLGIALTPTTQVFKQVSSSQEANKFAVNEDLIAKLDLKQQPLPLKAQPVKEVPKETAKEQPVKESPKETPKEQPAPAETIKSDSLKQQHQTLSRGGNPNGGYDMESYETFKLTAYTLSESDCDKNPGAKDYGISASGYNLEGEDLRNKKIAVDRRVIPLGSKVYIAFPEEIRYIKFKGETLDLNGEYTAVDVGGAIKGNKIDLFVGGDGSYYNKIADDIGVRHVKVFMRRD